MSGHARWLAARVVPSNYATVLTPLTVLPSAGRNDRLLELIERATAA